MNGRTPYQMFLEGISVIEEGSGEEPMEAA